MVVRPPPKWKVASSSLATPVSESRRSCSRAAALCCQEETRCAASNNWAIVYYPQPKTPWYKQAWFLGLFLGNFAGLLLLCGSSPIPRRFLESAFPYTAFGYYTGDLLDFMGRVLGVLVLPAVLTCIARRFYAWWGLLPVSLFLLWIAAGNIVSHTLSSVFDPFWGIPVVALLFWIVSSLPLSLFRFLRQRHRKTVTAFLNPAPQRPFPRWLSITALSVPLLAIVILGWYNIKHPLHFSVDLKTHWSTGKEASVPLIEIGHELYVKARLNDKEELCLLDTGADSVEWSRDLHIEGRLTSRRNQSCDVLGACVAAQVVVLPRVRIGGYEITNLPTTMLDNDPRLFTPPQGPGGGDKLLLGNPAFVMTVLTVDYKNAVMIIRPPGYDFTQQPRKVGERVIQMGWTTSASNEVWERYFFGTPSIRMSLAGASFWCTLDTGWGGSDLGLTSDFVEHHSSIRQARRDLTFLNATHSFAQVECLHNLNVTIPCLSPPLTKPISLTLGGEVTPTLDGDDDGGEGAIGIALMERYRITIDYGRRRVLLEPYAPVKSQTMQEKTATKAKPTGI